VQFQTKTQQPLVIADSANVSSTGKKFHHLIIFLNHLLHWHVSSTY
jgi:hypothetical protein